MKIIKFLFGLLAMFFVQNWACRTDHVIVKFYHKKDLEPMDPKSLGPHIQEGFLIKENVGI